MRPGAGKAVCKPLPIQHAHGEAPLLSPGPCAMQTRSTEHPMSASTQNKLLAAGAALGFLYWGLLRLRQRSKQRSGKSTSSPTPRKGSLAHPTHHPAPTARSAALTFESLTAWWCVLVAGPSAADHPHNPPTPCRTVPSSDRPARGAIQAPHASMAGGGGSTGQRRAACRSRPTVPRSAAAAGAGHIAAAAGGSSGWRAALWSCHAR